MIPTQAQTEDSVETIPEKIARLENELRLFDEFVRSPIWSLLKSQWQPLIDTTVGAALSPKAPDRSFLAGKVSGLRTFIAYPEKHLKKLQMDLKSLRTLASIRS